MLMLLTCDCGGAEPLARSILKTAGVENWLKVPIARGRQAALKWVDSLPPELASLPEVGALRSSISGRGKFSIVVGYTQSELKWAAVGSGRLQEKLDGEVIAKHYENMI